MDKTILKKLNLENEFTKTPKKQKVFNKVKNGVPPAKGFNYEADILYLPETENGNKYLLVVVDLADNSFDFQELKNRDAKTVLEAFKMMFKRGYIKKPEISIRTDSGSEFQKEFDKYLQNEEIIHSTTLKNRHKQTANVENLNKQLGNIFNHYMNEKELKSGEQENDWDDKNLMSTVRKEGNKIKTLKLPKYSEWNLKFFDPVKAGEAKFKIGDIVHRKLDTPKNALNNEQNTNNFRMGDFRYDTTPRKIIKVIYMPDAPFYRYMLEGIPQASYADLELLKSKETEQKFDVERFLEFRTNKKVKEVKVKWKGYLVKDATWESIDKMMEDVGIKRYKEYVEEYNQKNKKKVAFEKPEAKQKENVKVKFNLEGLRRSARLAKKPTD